MKQKIVWFVVFLCFCITDAHADNDTQLPVLQLGTYQDHVSTINAFIDLHGCQSLQNANIDENQILTEYLIFCNALARVDAHYDIRLTGYPINERMLDDLASGNLDATAVGVWSNEVTDDKLSLAAPLFREFEFVKGLYTTSTMVDKFTTFDDITRALTLTNQNWHLDWELMKCAGFTLIHVNQYEYMFSMLARGRGELIPLTFSNKPRMQRQPFNTPLYPLEGYKLVFPDTSHFVLRKDNAGTPELQEQLNSGLAILREEGAIQSVYQRLGLLNQRVANWQTIQCMDGAVITPTR
ncbi:hypothetical protein [Alteromonas sp. H39]|uniref:hypothetical protein n=1 Tax=Alteromonas sp. H39 TaxID=3389876 RepID=UPI0039E00921